MSGKSIRVPLFYEFSLEKQVPADHMLRSIDRFRRPGPVRIHLAWISHRDRCIGALNRP